MAEENTPSVSETDQQQADGVLSGDVDSMLKEIPGLDKYFGEASEDKPVPSEGEGEVSSPAPVTEEEPAAEPEPQPEVEEEAEKEEVPTSVQKRIDKLTAQKHQAIEKAEALELKVKELEGKVASITPLVPTPDSPLADVDTAQDLSKRLADAQKVKMWALEHLDGGDVEAKEGGTTFFDGQQVKHLLAISEALITQHIPDRRQYLETRAHFENEARTFYPNLYKAGTEENQTLNTWTKIFPEVRKFPDYQLIIADALVGQKMRLAKKAAKNGQKPTSKTPTLAAPSPSAGAKVSQKSVLSKDLLSRMATERSALDVFSESLIGKGS